MNQSLQSAVTILRMATPITLGRMGVIGPGITDPVVVGQVAGEELPPLALALTLTGVLLAVGIGASSVW